MSLFSIVFILSILNPLFLLIMMCILSLIVCSFWYWTWSKKSLQGKLNYIFSHSTSYPMLAKSHSWNRNWMWGLDWQKYFNRRKLQSRFIGGNSFSAWCYFILKTISCFEKHSWDSLCVESCADNWKVFEEALSDFKRTWSGTIII